MKSRVVIAGSVAQKVWQAGHAWQFLQYLLGFRRLGFDVLFLDWLSADMTAEGLSTSSNARYLRSVMEQFGLGHSYALLDGGSGESIAGLSRAVVLQETREAAFLLNVMGYLADEEILGAASRRVFLDTDPGYWQMWSDLGLMNPFRGHDVYVTIGEKIGRDSCSIPTCGIDWITTRQPVVLDEWPATNDTASGCFTSVGAWRGPYAPVEFHGETYGQRVHEFRKFVTLPRLTEANFELALDIDPADERDLTLLKTNGWRLRDPSDVARDPHTYRTYIANSKAEFMVARGMYVKTSCGWFSERSMCYLASGRPVLAQDTGIRDLYPTGEGLLVFSTLDEAIAGVDSICASYKCHNRAAREIAEEYFDSDLVLTRFLESILV